MARGFKVKKKAPWALLEEQAPEWKTKADNCKVPEELTRMSRDVSEAEVALRKAKDEDPHLRELKAQMAGATEQYRTGAKLARMKQDYLYMLRKSGGQNVPEPEDFLPKTRSSAVGRGETKAN